MAGIRNGPRDSIFTRRVVKNIYSSYPSKSDEEAVYEAIRAYLSKLPTSVTDGVDFSSFQQGLIDAFYDDGSRIDIAPYLRVETNGVTHTLKLCRGVKVRILQSFITPSPKMLNVYIRSLLGSQIRKKKNAPRLVISDEELGDFYVDYYSYREISGAIREFLNG